MEAKRIAEVIAMLSPGQEEQELLYVYKDDLVLTQPRPIYRVDGGAGDRYYYTVNAKADGGQEFIFYPSTTTFAKKVLPMGYGLMQWMKQNGENSDIIRDQRAAFGTLMHICFAEFLVYGYDYFNTPQLVEKYLEKTGNPRQLCGAWTLELNWDIAAFKQFCNDYEVEPVAIEMMLASDEMGMAGTLDFPCKMILPEDKKAYEKAVKEFEKNASLKNPKELAEPVKPEKKLAIVDFKSGGVHESAELQLAISKILFEENFPGLKVEGLYNWSPKEVRQNNTPGYNLTDQTNTKFTYGAMLTLLDYYNLMYPNEIADKKVINFAGKIENDGLPISNNVRTSTLGERIEKRFEANNSQQY